MKDEALDWLQVIIVAILVFLGAFCLGYGNGHAYGYIHGANQAKTYYEATGEFPTESWLGEYEGTRFYSDDILNALTR